MTDPAPRDSATRDKTHPGPSGELLRFFDCAISSATREVWLRGQRQPVRRKVFDLLLLLIDQRPQTVSHAQIALALWGSKRVSPTRVARAVMEARRLIGDDPDTPRHLISVRGVGYRFAAEVAHAEVDVQTRADGADADAGAARADIDAAAACLRHGDCEEARRLVDRAIATADLAGARRELARAMALAACILLRGGSPERALGLAARAMHMAQLEGRSDVLAEVRLGLAEVQLWIGSPHAALEHLLIVHRALSVQEPGFALWRCESLFGEAYRRLGRLEEAWPWCERAEASALQREPQARAIRERLVKVAVLHDMIERAEAEGRDDDLRVIGLRALEGLDAIEADARVVGSPFFALEIQTWRGLTLAAMGRVEAAWAVIESLRPVLFGAAVVSTPWLDARRQAFRRIEARLLSLSGRAIEAIEVIEAAIAMAPTAADVPSEPSRLLGLAAAICERAGRYKEGLAWMRRQQRSIHQLHADRAQATASIVRAQLESDRLGDELVKARADVERLQQLNHQLQRRLVQLDRHPLLDEGGLVPAAGLAAMIEGRAALARERELPLCLGVVQSAVAADVQGEGADLARRRQSKRLSSALKAVIPEASAAAQWRPGLYVFIFADLGLGPARLRCQALVQRLNADLVLTTDPQPAMCFRADAVDLTRFPGIDAALVEVEAAAIPAPRRVSA